jgi:hypothetical protein
MVQLGDNQRSAMLATTLEGCSKCVPVIAFIAFSGTHLFFIRQVLALNNRFDHPEQMLLAPLPAAADTHAPPLKDGKKHG